MDYGHFCRRGFWRKIVLAGNWEIGTFWREMWILSGNLDVGEEKGGKYDVTVKTHY